MHSPTALDTPPAARSGTSPAKTKTLRLSRWRLGAARLNPFLALPLALLLGAGGGAAALLSAQNAHAVVATVNGVPIRDRAFYHRLEVAAGPQVLQQMVSEEMAIQFAAKEGVPPSDAQVQAKLDAARRQPGFAARLAASRQTEDDLRHSLLAGLAQSAVMTRGVSVTDAEVQAFYRKNVDTHSPSARYYAPEATQIAVIVTPTAQAAARAVGDLAAGRPFAQVAAQDSLDPSKAHGGLLPPLLHGRSALTRFPRLEDTVFAMQVGQQLNAVKIGSQWWIIRCVGHRAAATQAYSDVQDEAREGALLEKGLPANGPAMQRAFADFQRASAIKPVWPQYQPAAQAAPAP